MEGYKAVGLEEKAETPAGRERTPAPTQAFITLKVDEVMEDFFESIEEASEDFASIEFASFEEKRGRGL